MCLLVVLLLIAQSPTTCGDVADCRKQALAAAAAGEYETFHDLAWRAVQIARTNDPDLMYLLARAQSLSGRPGDALVMLQRLVELGVTVDAATNDDFRRVRALKGWPDLEARIAGKPASPPRTEPAAAERTSERTESRPEAAPASSRPAADKSEEALSFDAPPFAAIGLAYDAVSRRFIVGDRKGGRLIVVDEVSHHVANLVSAASAGFYDTIAAFEIDARRGDLWVASVKSDTRESVLHKLQLVSGRVLDEIRLTSGGDTPPVVTDVAIAADGTILALDGDGGRIVRVRPKSRTAEDAAKVELPGARSLTIADERTVYIASDSGITKVDLPTHTATPLHVPRNADVAHVDRIRWHDGALILMQRTADGESRIARARLDGTGGSITRIQVLAVSREAVPPASTVSGSELYYLVPGASGPSIRRAKLK